MAMTLSSHIRRANRPQPPSDQEQHGWVPPDETTWERYSPNGESIIAGIASLMLHAALVAILLTGLWAMAEPRQAPLVVEVGVGAFPTGDDVVGGGQGNNRANGLIPGAAPQHSDETKPLNVDDARRPDRVVPKEDIAVQPSRPATEEDPLGEAISKKLASRSD